MWAPEEDTKKPLLRGPDDKGRPLENDPNWKGMKREGRSCNDVLFAILFAGMVAGMVVISSIAYSQGNPQLLVPDSELVEKYGTGAVQGWFQNAVAEARQDTNVLIGSVALAFVLGFVWIQLMKTLTRLFIYLSLFLGLAAVVAVGVYIFIMGQRQNSEDIKIVAIITWAVAILLALILFFLRKKIDLTCAMFTETCRGVQASPSIFPVAFIVVAMFLGFAAYWVSSFIYLYSIPGATINTDDSTSSGAQPTFNTKIRNLMLYMVFGFLWVSALLSAVFQHSVAGAVSSWYFSRDVNGPAVGSPAFVSLGHAFTTSFGSLAFGSLVIAFIEFLQFILQMTQRANAKNRFLVFWISCLQCILGCILGIVQFVNKWAYIYIAMHGYSFCTAARECFDLISRNMFSAVVMDLIGEFVLFLGKLLFTAISVFLTVAIVDHMGRQLSLVTVLLCAGLSFVVLHIFSQIIGAGVDTVFVCYLEDLERNKDGNLYISPDLHRLLQDRATELNAEKQKAQP